MDIGRRHGGMLGTEPSNPDVVPSRRPRVGVLGSYKIDLTVQCSDLPTEDQTIVGSGLQILGGGSAGNAAVAAARAGCEVFLVGGHGADAFGKLARAHLTKEGIQLDYFQEIGRTMTGVAVCLQSQETGRSILVRTDSANQRLTPALVQTAKRAIQESDLVITDTEAAGPFVAETMKICAECDVPCVLHASVGSRLRDLPDDGLLVLVVPEADADGAFNPSEPAAVHTFLHRKKIKNLILFSKQESLCYSHDVAEPALRVAHSPPGSVVEAIGTFALWLGLQLISRRSLGEAYRIAAAAVSGRLSHLDGPPDCGREALPVRAGRTEGWRQDTLASLEL